MKSLVLLLATVALASATFYGGKYIDIKEDGSVFIKTEDGKQVYITKNYGPHGQKLEVEVTGPNYFTKSYQFDFNNRVSTSYKNYQGQYDILDVIFREYLGHVDEYTYQQLLNKVHKAVLNGFFDSRVFYLLQALIEDTKWDNLVSGYNFYGQFGGFLNAKAHQGKYELGNLFRGQGVQDQYYTQYDTYYFYNILMKIFDKQVLHTVFNQQQMVNQEMYGQYSYEKMWDMIFTHEGIFDHQFIVEILNNEELRSYFVQQGFFDVDVLNQLRVAYKTKGVYDQYLIQRLVNTQVLKNFFISHKISVYDILEHTSLNAKASQGKYELANVLRGQGVHDQYYTHYGMNNFYNVLMKIFDKQVLQTVFTQKQMFNQEMYGQYTYEKIWDMIFTHEGIFDYQFLVEILNNEELRNLFVQQGFFDVNVLNQLRVAYKTEGVYDQYLLQRLFNTQVLKNFFVNHKISVYDILGHTSYKQYYDSSFYNRGYYGNNFLYKNNFFQQTPKMSYNHVFGVYGNIPEYAKNMQMYGGNFWKNMLYGQSYYGYNKGPYNFGKFYQQYPLAQQVY